MLCHLFEASNIQTWHALYTSNNIRKKDDEPIGFFVEIYFINIFIDPFFMLENVSSSALDNWAIIDHYNFSSICYKSMISK